jgi:hypothetical protein
VAPQLLKHPGATVDPSIGRFGKTLFSIIIYLLDFGTPKSKNSRPDGDGNIFELSFWNCITVNQEVPGMVSRHRDGS